jgi:hypothetical protein
VLCNVKENMGTRRKVDVSDGIIFDNLHDDPTIYRNVRKSTKQHATLRHVIYLRGGGGVELPRVLYR